MRWVKLRRIAVGSAFRIGFVVGLVTSAILMIPFAILSFLVLTSLSSVLVSSGTFNGQTVPSGVNLFGGAGLLSILCQALLTVVLGGVFGAIGAAISAWAYNIAAGSSGGLEVQLAGDFGEREPDPPFMGEKAKWGSSVDQ